MEVKDKLLKVINKLLTYFKRNKLFLAYIIISTLTCSLLRIITIGFDIYFKAFITDTLLIILIGLFGYLFKNKNRFTYYMFIICFLSALSIGNTIYYQFYSSYISINLLSTVSMIGEVNDSLWNKIHLIQFIYLIFPITFVLYNKYLKKNNYYLEEDNISLIKLFKRICIYLIVISSFLALSISIDDIDTFDNQFNRGYIVKKHGLILYTVNDLIQSVDLDYDISYDESALLYKNFYGCKWDKKKEVNEYTDIFKGKNVLFIHAESIQNILIDLRINGKEVTPNINKFAREGMYFSNFYPQISVGTSSDTEFTLLTGLMPSSKGTVFVNYYDRKYIGMPKYFNDLGYYTFSMHGNDRNYWNRATMHERLGYQKFYGEESYDVPLDINDKDHILLGLSDKSFFNQSISKLQNIKDNKSPFFGTMITLSNHSPFNDVEKYGDFNVKLKYKNKVRDYIDDTTIGNYIKSSHYADEAFGEFINKLKKTNILDNTIIVFYGDHESRISKSELDLLYNYNPKTDKLLPKDDPAYIDVNNYYYDLIKNTPLIIWSNEMDLSSEITETMGMYDILPTIANMFGFEEKYSLGHDIFSDEENIIVFPNGNIITDKIYYNDLYEEYITLNNDAINKDYINDIRGYANNILEVSNGIITYDLIDKIKEGDYICEKR